MRTIRQRFAAFCGWGPMPTLASFKLGTCLLLKINDVLQATMFRYLFLHLLSGWEEWSWAALTSFRQCFWMSSYSFENPMSLSTCNDACNFQKVVLLKSSSLNECRLVCQQRFLPFKTTRRFRIPHLCWIDALGMILIHYLEPLVWYFATAYCEDLSQDNFFT